MKKLVVLVLGMIILGAFMLQLSSAENDALEQKIRILASQAAKAEREGNAEEVREILRIIEHLKQQRDEHVAPDEKVDHAQLERQMHETHRRLEHLLDESADAFREKDGQRAKQLHQEAQQLAQHLIDLEIKARVTRRDRDAHRDEDHHKHQHGEHEDGDHHDHERADHDHEHADHEHRHHDQDEEFERAKQNVQHLSEAAEHLKMAGRREEAEHFFNQANEMKEHLHRDMQRRQNEEREHGAHEGHSLERVMHVVHELHQRMAILGEQLEEAHERIGNLERRLQIRRGRDKEEDDEEEDDDEEEG
jgi:hypothetical protein